MEDLSDSEWSAAPEQSSPSRTYYQTFLDRDSTTSSAEASDLTLYAPRSPTARRRRLFTRHMRTGSNGRANTEMSFNPEAAAFVPAVRMPSKRKASSSAKSGKSIQIDTHANLSRPQPDIPIIKAEDIFDRGTATRMSPDVALDGLLDSSDEEVYAIEASLSRATGLILQQDRDAPRAERQMIEAIARTKAQSAKRAEGARKYSAILVSRDDTSSNDGTSEVSAGRLRYLPLCPVQSGQRFVSPSKGLLTILPNHRERIRDKDEMKVTSKAMWPLNELPVELFDLITSLLARDDVKCMRLVNKEFERKVSRSLFHTSVVPFNTELYDMIDEDQKASNRTPRIHGKGKARVRSTNEVANGVDVGGLQWQNAKEDKEGKVYKGHGLRVFQGFGPHIKRFGMSFEVSESQLMRPPIKKELDHVESYHGIYDWPSLQYARYASLAGLENTADETSRMKAAFANLEIVQELALSVNSGLGWLNGPDKSIRGRIFERPSAVFGSAYKVPDRAVRVANDFWTALEQCQGSFAPNGTLKEAVLEYRPLSFHPAQLEGLGETLYSETQAWSAIDQEKARPSAPPTTFSGFGVLYTSPGQSAADMSTYRSPLMPSDLNKEQKEWLLETQWAQQAFLESYVLSIIDNPTTFANVTTLNIAKLSASFLPMLARAVFWDALPKLSQVVLHVSPDWRTVEKDEAGFAETSFQNPSEAVRFFHKAILRNRIAQRQYIKKLDIGWFDGGESAEGIFARNNNLLPAPITSLEHSTANSSIFGLVFKHVEHLTLHNCWISPPTLEGLVKSHSNLALKRITLDSVSLTAHPRLPVNAQGQVPQQIAQMIAAAQAQMANNAAVPNQANPVLAQQQMQQQQQWTQQMLQMQQAMLANQPNVPNNALNAQFAALQNMAPPQIGQQAPLAMPAPNPNPIAPATVHWTNGYREGSWPQLIDSISPGPVFDDYLPAPPPWEEQPPPRPETSLQTIEFQSCGYAKLPNHRSFDQTVLDPDLAHTRVVSTWFKSRLALLKAAMMCTSDANVGYIVQCIPQRELDALQLAWGLTHGWDNLAKSEESEFDGLLPGGTGRFSGTVEKGMALVAEREDLMHL